MIESGEVLTADKYADKLSGMYPVPQKAFGNLTMQQFFALLYHVLDIEKPGLVIAPAFPRYLMKGTQEHKATMDNPTEKFVDTITYKITREEPGSIGGSKQPFGTTREVAPRLRQIKNPETKDEKDTQIYGQWFDTLVQFDIWTLTNWQADISALWFKRFMTSHRDFFKYMGLSEILFWWRGVDDTSTQLDNGLNVRTLAYYVRTEELSTINTTILKELKLEVEKRIEDV